MRESFTIKQVAVLGAGVMGAQIAAHCANAGIKTLLYDMAPKEGSANGLVEKALANLAKLKPAPLANMNTLALLQPRNYEENLADLSGCDLVIEAIAERLDWKEALYKNISPHLSEHSILASNTSGLSVNALAEVLPKQHRARFCGLHFFNPPRYMHLAELIPAKETSKELLDNLETWLTSYLGKGVVRAKDTPNFIANRIGVFSLLSTLHHTLAMGLSLDEVDLLTGTLVGRPKSATYRTMDVVGLDTMKHVVHTMQEHLKEDPWHPLFHLPEWLNALIEAGHLGQKTGQGIYKKNGKNIEVYDIQTKSYKPTNATVSPELISIMKNPDPVARMQALTQSKEKQAQFLTACFRDLFHYSAYHLQDIAHTTADLDLAIRWGFGWAQGPFETWQLAGLESMIELIKSGPEKSKLPQWVSDIKAFYTEQGAYSPQSKQYEPRNTLAVYQRQLNPDTVLKAPTRTNNILYENEGVCLEVFNGGIGVLHFKSKANTIGQAVIDGLEAAIDCAEQKTKGLVIHQKDATNFSSGADLRAVSMLIKENKMQAVGEMIAQFQNAVMRLKYCSIPTVAALRGRALGGGCELMLHCNSVVAAFESYPGLVEIGVGVLPAGGGCKEMALHAASQGEHTDLLPYIQAYFQQMATAKVASSAPEAMQMGYLTNKDNFLMHANEVLYAALAQVELMHAMNYQAPVARTFKVAGIEGHAGLQAGLVNWLEGGFISQYDFQLANELAGVLCGGAVNQGTQVDEHWMLKLEREAFVRLVSQPLTQARITHILETGKPLRN